MAFSFENDVFGLSYAFFEMAAFIERSGLLRAYKLLALKDLCGSASDSCVKFPQLSDRSTFGFSKRFPPRRESSFGKVGHGKDCFLPEILGWWSLGRLVLLFNGGFEAGFDGCICEEMSAMKIEFNR